jgi:SAM-dependent methyltransferase
MNERYPGIATPAQQKPPEGPRTIYGFYEDRLAGLRDLFQHAQGMSVLDVAMNHGLVGFEFARRGASIVHGCDYHEPAVAAARAIFAELAIPSKFALVDLTGGPAALEAAFGKDYLARYDIVLFLGIYHKLKDQTSDDVIAELVRHLADRTLRYFAVRAASGDLCAELGPLLASRGLRRVHFSALSPVVGPLEIWQRGEASPYLGTH